MKYVFLIATLAMFFVLSLGSALNESLTFDEIVHLQEGVNHLTQHSFVIDTNNPPFVRELSAIPELVGLREPIYARLVTIILGELLLLSVFFFTRRYFGTNPALLSVFILSLEPTFLAHSHYVTLDTGFAVFFFLAWWAFISRRFILFGVLFGLAGASRVTSWVFMMGSGLWFLQYMNLRKLFVAGFLSLLMIWATYFFRSDVIIAERADPTRISSKLEMHENLRNLIFFLKTQPVPLGNYLAMIKNNIVRAGQSPPTFLLPINFFLKTPVPMLLFFALFFIIVVSDGKFRKKTKLIWIPLLVIFGVSSVSGQQPWVRYLLPMYPFFIIGAALAIHRFPKLLIILLFIWLSIGTFVQYPYFISYANEFAGPRENRFEKLTDSNLDWGQALPDVVKYIQENNPVHVSFSYFGRDNGDHYGLISNMAWGGYKFEEICAFHEIPRAGTGPRIVAISATNWHQCGYSKLPEFTKERLKSVIAESILIF